MSAGFGTIGRSQQGHVGSLDVLLVEDDPGEALLVREMLADASRAPCTLRHAPSLREGLREIAAAPPSCLLLDLDLPDASGFDGLHRVLDAAPHVPVIVLTGRLEEGVGEMGVGEMAVHLGAQDYLVKGRVDGDLLDRSMRHAIERHEARRLLEASEARIRAMVDHMPVGNCSVGTDGRIREINLALASRLGAAPRSLLGTALDEIVAHPVRPFAGWLKRLRAGSEDPQGLTMVARLHAIGGPSVDVRITAAPVRNAAAEVTEVVLVVEDLTGAHVAEEELRSSEARFRALVHNLSEAVLIFDERSVLRYATPSAERVIGNAGGGAGGAAGMLLDLVHPDDRRGVQKAFRSWQRRDHGPAVVACRVVRPDGAWRSLELLGVNLLGDEAVQGIVVTARDVTEREEAERERAHQALHDPLTGLPNRQLFMNRLQHALQRAARTAQHVAVLLVDVDRFKTVNEAFGPDGGDEVLVAISQLLDGVVRPDDTVARFGGDEFIVLCEGLDAHGARVTAAKLAEVLTRPFGDRGTKVHLSVSVGIAVAPPAQRTGANELVRDADAALSRAKAEGRGRSVLFDGVLRQRTLRRTQLEEALREATSEGQFELHYQPQVDLSDGSVRAYESLLRWHHPGLGSIGPAEFVPIAEETGAIREIGQWALEEGCRQLAAWRSQRPGTGITIAVNVSAQQLADPTFGAGVRRALAEHELPAGALRLEITESAVMDDPENSAQVLRELKEAGVRLSIDDFGTGYSSLAYLKRFPIDELKIDRAFIAGLGRDAADTVIVSSVVHLAKSLGIAVVAEGVETQQQIDQLVALGCDAGQGFFWARAEPSADAVRHLDAGFAANAAAAGHLLADVVRLHDHDDDAGGRHGAALDLDAIATVVHELRTPITVIRGFSEMMADLVHNGRTDLLDGALDAVHRQARQMELLVADLADASAVSSGPPTLSMEQVDLGEVVRGVVDDLQSILARHRLEVSGPAIGLEGDAARVVRIVTNLLTNAAKFSPEGSRIVVALRREAGHARVHVIDEGPGVPSGRVGELFGKFSRLGSAAKGMGLGLYLSRELARAHGGDLWHQPATTGGAEFVLRLPSGPAPPTPVAAGATRTGTLLHATVDAEAVSITDAALRRLLQVQLPEQVVQIAIRLVRDLGGTVTPASHAGADAIPVDVSFGEGEPLVVVAAGPSIARLRLEQVLPHFLEDAIDVVQACRRPRRSRGPSIDPVTGFLTRRAILAPLSASAGEGGVLLVGLDAVPSLDALDAAMRWLARSTVEAAADGLLAGRWDRQRLVVAGASADELETLARAVQEGWRRFGSLDTDVSAAITRTAPGAPVGLALQPAVSVLRRAGGVGGGVLEVLGAS